MLLLEKGSVTDTITKYSIKPKTLYASNDNTNKIITTRRYDILSSIFICLGKETLNSKNKLIRMLSTLLSPKLPVETKKSILEVEYDLPMTREMESEAVTMCNLSDLIEEEATKKANIKAIITMIEFNIPKDTILTKYSKDEYNQALKEINKQI